MLLSLGAAALFATYATITTGKAPSPTSILGLVYVAGVLCAAGKPSATSAALSSLALVAAAGAQATVRPATSATEMCGGAAAGVPAARDARGRARQDRQLPRRRRGGRAHTAATRLMGFVGEGRLRCKTD